MTTAAPPECPGAAPAAPGGGNRGGTLARAGRRRLRDELTTPAPTATGPRCDCARCAPAAPLSDLEAQRALRHVPTAIAVAYATGLVEFVSCVDCPACGAWVPQFVETDD